jgi:glyoxylase-like metal-dependent hydrolase (beta-lactamase superfamily II)
MPELADHGIARLRADNPSPYTLDGTNTWVIGRDPGWVVDPGPALEEHLDAIAAEVERRGGAGGIALTHDHPDHAEGTEAMRAALGDPPVAAMRWPGATAALSDGDAFGPLRALHVPGHAEDHVVFVAGDGAFTGDAVLGIGSVFIAPGGGSLGAYLDGLRRLRDLGLARLYPGHGPVVEDPAAKLDDYVAHRLERERRILAAWEAGARTDEELLAGAWDGIPPGLELPATGTLHAHLDKLRDEGAI